MIAFELRTQQFNMLINVIVDRSPLAIADLSLTSQHRHVIEMFLGTHETFCGCKLSIVHSAWDAV